MHARFISVGILVGLLTFSVVAEDDIGPKPQADSPSKGIAVIDSWLQKRIPGYRFQRFDVTEGDYQAQNAWLIDYYFLRRTAYGGYETCHARVYFRDGQPVGATEPKSLEEEQDEEQKIKEEKTAEEMEQIRQRLVLSGGAQNREGDYLYVYGKVTNNGSVPVRFIRVHLVGYNQSKEIVSSDDAYATSSEYLRPGETAKFKAMLEDEQQEIVSVEWEITKIDDTQVLTQ